jgi:hypothetical protein
MRYIPILRWKRGERVGLSHVTLAGKKDVVPLVALAPDQFRNKAATASRPTVSAAEAFVNELVTAWGKALAYVDGSSLPHAIGTQPLVDIAAAAKSAGAPIIPATWLDAPPAYQAAVKSVVQADKKGVALRVDLEEFTSASSWVSSWPFALNETDLIVDLAENVILIGQLGHAVDTAFQKLHQPKQWRSVTMAGSSMPGNFSGYQAGTHLLPRAELTLWKKLSKLKLPYVLQFGDYTSVSPNAPPQGIAWGFPINVRYTRTDDFLICRGVGTTGHGGIDMDQQLIEHAKKIVSYPKRGPLAHCWADTRIDNIAAGKESPGNLEAWVQIGVNRHIELTRQTLP